MIQTKYNHHFINLRHALYAVGKQTDVALAIFVTQVRFQSNVSWLQKCKSIFMIVITFNY